VGREALQSKDSTICVHNITVQCSRPFVDRAVNCDVVKLTKVILNSLLAVSRPSKFLGSTLPVGDILGVVFWRSLILFAPAILSQGLPLCEVPLCDTALRKVVDVQKFVDIAAFADSVILC
jgi:hypothetical protein